MSHLLGKHSKFLRRAAHQEQVPQWYGETVGFWDGTTLVAWTANIQPWTQHTMFETSAKMETIEVIKPAYDAKHKFIGIELSGDYLAIAKRRIAEARPDFNFTIDPNAKDITCSTSQT